MTADEEGWIEGMSEFYISVDDGWSRIFVMILGTALPDNKVKEQFVDFCKREVMEATGELTPLNESDMIHLFPMFLEELLRQ